MLTIKFDEKENVVALLYFEVKNQLAAIEFVKSEHALLKAKVATLHTALLHA